MKTVFCLVLATIGANCAIIPLSPVVHTNVPSSLSSVTVVRSDRQGGSFSYSTYEGGLTPLAYIAPVTYIPNYPLTHQQAIISHQILAAPIPVLSPISPAKEEDSEEKKQEQAGMDGQNGDNSVSVESA